MKVEFTDTFFKSFKENVIDASKWYKLKFWEHRWWDLNRGLKNLKAYFKVVFNIHPYNGDITFFELTKVSLERLLKYLEKGDEIEETRLPKIENIKRSIELIEHFLENDFAERCGWDSENIDIFEPPTKSDIEALDKGHKLEQEEWNELFDLLKQIRSWWD